MSRPPRCDVPGGVFHVTNRGRLKSPIFLDPKDRRFFLSRVAYAARRREIEVLAFVLMTNHFHLLLRSLGKLSEALRRIENEHARRFNRRHSTEGMLCRGRFFSVMVEDWNHLRNSILYLDENPIPKKQRRPMRPEDYLWGSARRFACPKKTPWLSQWGIETAGVTYGPAAPDPAPEDVRKARAWFIEARLRCGEHGEEGLPVLLSNDPERIHAWLVRRTDGARALPTAGEGLVLSELRRVEPEFGETIVRLRRTRGNPILRLLAVGLLRDLSVVDWRTIASLLGTTDTTAKRWYRLHARALAEDPAYAELACRVTVACAAWLRQ
jgi:REP element-mobilizing transposase RayT